MWESLIGPVVGGLLGGQGSKESSTSQNSIDPRMAEYIYGGSGVLPMASEWYKKNSTGLNPQMVSGMNNQWDQLNKAAPGYSQMQNLGLSLMGAPIAGNPFTSSGAQGAQGQGAQGVAPSQGGPFSMPTTSPYQAQQEAIKNNPGMYGLSDSWGNNTDMAGTNGNPAMNQRINDFLTNAYKNSVYGKIGSLFGGGNDGGYGLAGDYGDTGGASLGGGLGGGAFGGIGNDGYGDMGGGYW
jgi:hypothetical protein